MEGIINPPDVLRIALRGSGNESRDIPGEFSDDPLMFESIYKLEQGKTDDIMAEVKANLQRLLAQLNALPLENGNAKKAIQGLIKTIKK